jgi:hypothetical protein
MDNYDNKVILDKCALALFGLVFILIQVVFAIIIWRSYTKIKKLQKDERDYAKSKAASIDVTDSDDEYPF